MTQYDDKDIREGSAYVLGTIFPYIPDKEQAWLDLHRLTLDGENYVRKNAVLALGFAFLHIPDKEQACADLHRLIEDSDEYVRYGAAIALGSVFSHLSDKEPAWKDLTRLVQDKTGYVQSAAIISLGIVFPHVPDKKLAWDILHLMTRYVHDASAVAIGLAFPCIPDKKQAWTDLIWLAQDKDKDVRGSANYSLGKASIFKATETESEEDFRKKLEKALEFFEKSSKDAIYHNPAIFCLPFYRSFYTITFKKQDAKIEVQKYLTEAKIASEGSESREKLLDAVENLANALKEVQEASDKGFNAMKCDLNAYMRYCERATDLLEITEEKAPGATKLIRKGLPIIDQRIKELLGEIEEKAKKLCKESQKTPLEKISRNAYEHVKGLGETENPIKAEISLNGLAPLLQSMCHILPEESREVICNQLDEMEESELSDKARIIGSALSSIHPQIINLEEKLAERERWIEYFKNLVVQRLDNINYGVFQLKIRSGEIVPKLHEIQHELKKLIIIKTDLDNIGLNIKDFGNLQHHDIQKLNDEITLLCGKIETEIIPKLPKANDAHRIIEIQKKIQYLKQSKEEIWFNRVAGLSSIVGLILTIL